jgi:ribosomal protein L29
MDKKNRSIAQISEEIKSMCDEELAARVVDLQENLAAMRAKESSVKATQADTGEYADPVWFAKLRTAIRYKGIEYNMAVKEKADRSKSKRRATATTFERKFMKVAKRRIEEELFAEIWREAMDEAVGE